MAGKGLATRAIGLQPRERWQEPAIRQLNTFILELGRNNFEAGTEMFKSLVALSAVGDERLDQLLGAFALEEAQGLSPGEIVAGIGLRPGEILKIVRDAALSVAQARSIAQLAEHLPNITLDVATRAQVHFLPCAKCQQTGKITGKSTVENPAPTEESCDACHGQGSIRMEADLDRQQLALDMGKLLPKSAGTNIAVVNNNNNGGVMATSGVFSSIVRATDRILHGDGLARRSSTPSAEAVVDAVVVDSPTSDPREESEDDRPGA